MKRWIFAQYNWADVQSLVETWEKNDPCGDDVILVACLGGWYEI